MEGDLSLRIDVLVGKKAANNSAENQTNGRYNHSRNINPIR